MECSYIYLFFNNATVSAVIAVFVGAYIAKSAYKEQKKIDRTENNKKDILKDFEALNSKVKSVLSMFLQISDTAKHIKKRGEEPKIDTVNEKDREERLKEAQNIIELLKSLEQKYPQIATILYQELPAAIDVASNKIAIYFNNSSEVRSAFTIYEKELKKWVDLIRANLFRDALLKDIKQVESIDIKPANDAFEKLIKTISLQ